MNEVAITGDKRMTVKEVAQAFNCAESTIQKHIKDIFPEIVQHGKTTWLTEKQVTQIKLELGVHGNSLPSSGLPKTLLEKQMLIRQASMLQDEIIADLTRELEESNKQLQMQAPKVDFYDAVTGSNDAIDMKNAAKVLNMGIGRNILFDILRENKILMADNSPYQKYIDSGYFRVIESKWNTPDGETRISLKTVVYQKGIEFIRKVVRDSK